VKAARLDADRLVVARSHMLDVYDVATGARERQLPLPSGYTLTDVDGRIAVPSRERQRDRAASARGRPFARC